MKGFLTLADGGVCALPPLLSWELRYTGSVPCDSFRVSFAYASAMTEALRTAARFMAEENGAIALYGVVDEVEVSLRDAGRTAEVSGRGLAALLLDSEAEAATFQNPSAAEVLARYAAPSGIVYGAVPELRSAQPYRVAGGGSEWKALEGFLSRFPGTAPYFTREGRLELGHVPGRAVLREESLLVLERHMRRHGVVSEVALVTRGSGERAVVRGEDAVRQGIRARRVVYVDGNDPVGARREAEELLARSAAEADEVTALVVGHFPALPGDTVELVGTLSGAAGAYCVSETVRRFGSGGETTELTMRRE